MAQAHDARTAGGDAPALAFNGAAVLPNLPFGSDADGLDLMLVRAGGNPARFNDRATFAWLRTTRALRH